MEPAVLRQDRGAIRWLTLNRPRSANAIDTALANGLSSELDAAASDGNVGAVVVTGAGHRVFCAGVDIRNGEDGAQRRTNLRLCFWSILDFPKPLIFAVNGIASGGGCMLALLGDQRVIADDTAFVLPEIDLGIPTFPALAILSGLIGDALAADLVLTGRRFAAAEAAHWGLAQIAERDGLVAEAQSRAEFLAAKPAETYRRCKSWLNQRRRQSIEQATEAGMQMEEGR